jgi:hypothetical protein
MNEWMKAGINSAVREETRQRRWRMIGGEEWMIRFPAKNPWGRLESRKDEFEGLVSYLPKFLMGSLRAATGSHSHFGGEVIALVLKQAEALADDWNRDGK